MNHSPRVEKAIQFMLLTSIFTGLTIIGTVICTINFSQSGGYFNLGEAIIYVAALIFGPYIGAIAGGVGSMLADLINGYPQWALGSLIIKALEGFLVGFVFSRLKHNTCDFGKCSSKETAKLHTAGLILALLIIVFGTITIPEGYILWLVVGVILVLVIAYSPQYFSINMYSIIQATSIGACVMVTGYFLYNWIFIGQGGFAEIPLNVIQCLMGMYLAIALYQIKARIEERTSELKKVQTQLIRQEKLATIGKIAGSVSHELRNPLNVIFNSIYYLHLKLTNDDAKIKGHLALIQKTAEKMNVIISSLLDFARLKTVTLEKVELHDIVKKVLAETTIPRGIHLSCNFAECPPSLDADPALMAQVFRNLINNAIQSMQAGGELEIKADHDADEVKISVKDTGVGIPRENIQHIFEPLFTTKSKGIGLGLSVTKDIIDKHDGHIDVESRIGRGTEFIVTLPILRQQSREC